MNDKKNTKVFWMRGKRNQRIACLATRKVGKNFIVYALATHNPVDKFNKAAGRTMAIQRLDSDSARAIIDDGVSNIRAKIFQDIVAAQEAPYKVQRSAADWLKYEFWENFVGDSAKDKDEEVQEGYQWPQSALSKASTTSLQS